MEKWYFADQDLSIRTNYNEQANTYSPLMMYRIDVSHICYGREMLCRRIIFGRKRDQFSISLHHFLVPWTIPLTVNKRLLKSHISHNTSTFTALHSFPQIIWYYIGHHTTRNHKFQWRNHQVKILHLQQSAPKEKLLLITSMWANTIDCVDEKMDWTSEEDW